MRTLFFDIDGTLLVTQGAGSHALRSALLAEFALEAFSMETIQFGGRTDRDLVGQILRLAEIDVTEENRGRLRRSYASQLRHSLKEVGGEVCPGVTELLPALDAIPGISLAVMTGNFPETARMKLQRFQIEGYFPWIVGGDLDQVRCDMARRAANQLRRNRGEEATSDMIVIGDTPNDVRCAQSMKARCLAVCTGSATREALEIAGADLVVEDLCDSRAISFLMDD